MICKNCNHINAEGIDFCEFCGEKIQKDTVNLEKDNSYEGDSSLVNEDVNYSDNNGQPNNNSNNNNINNNSNNNINNNGQSNNNFARETKFCRSCGAEIVKEAVICVKCGVTTNDTQVEDDGNILAAVAACCFPIVGIVLYFIWKDTKPKSAKNVCIAALIPTVLGILAYVFLFILGISVGI